MAAINPDDVITLIHPSAQNSVCKVHQHGATVISWVCEGEEMLFVSSKSHFDNKKAIRGGIPLVFPCFGPWDLGPQHGFARISHWSLHKEPTKDEAGNVFAVFALEDSEDTRKIWNYSFRLEYKITLAPSALTTELCVNNTGNETLEFTCLLHTYFRVPDVTKCTVSGLKGLQYIDKVAGGETFTENRDLVAVAENVDRIYKCTPVSHTLTCAGAGRTINITKHGLPDTVLWNPWAEKAAAMSDFGDDEYSSMLCVEPGHVAAPVSVLAQHTFQASQTLTARL